MNTIETIRREIGRRKEQIAGLFTPDSNEYYAAQDEAYNDLLSFLDTLQEPSLPSNPDEAARQIATDILGKDYLSELDEDCAIDALNEAISLVKAGAEWMAGQAVKRIQDWERDFDDHYLTFDNCGSARIMQTALKDDLIKVILGVWKD